MAADDNAMSCTQLAERLQGPLMRDGESTVVVVMLDEYGIGPHPAAFVTGAYQGIDWDMGRMLLATDKRLVSWEYIERYVPDIRQQVEDAIHERNMAALNRITEEGA